MSYLVLLANAKELYDVCKTINELFVDETKEILRAISEKELISAIKTLDDIKYSNDKRRELASTITQLRLANEKMDSADVIKAETALLIALCYKTLNEIELSLKFGDSAVEYFNKYIDSKQKWVKCVAKETNRDALLGIFIDELKEVGIDHKDIHPYQDKSFFEIFWTNCRASERLKNVVREARKEFSIAVKNLLAT